MKKFLLSMSLMFVALTLTSCAKDAAEENVVPAGKGFSFVADIDGTRATVDGMKTVWESGDQVAFRGVAESSTYTTCRLYGFDYVSAKIILPLGGIIICLFVGWKLDRQMVYNEVTNNGTLHLGPSDAATATGGRPSLGARLLSRLHPFRIYIFLVRWVAPTAIAVIFINELLR